MYRCYKKKKSATDDNEITPNGVISEAQLQTISNDLKELKHSMSLITDNSDYLENNFDSLEKTWDVFISYRRSNGSLLASLLRNNLEAKKFSVFLDVDRYSNQAV